MLLTVAIGASPLRCAMKRTVGMVPLARKSIIERHWLAGMYQNSLRSLPEEVTLVSQLGF